MTETNEFPTEEQKQTASGRIQTFEEQFDSLMDAFQAGKITREEFRGAIAVQQAASEARIERAKDKALTDDMTGLWNNKGFRMEYEETVERLKRSGNGESREHAVLINMDLNGLKEMNDTNGHEAGNQIIIKFARILKENSRSVDSLAKVARPHGDEFLAILHNTDQRGVIPWWNRIIPKLEAEGLRVSIGSAEIDPSNPEETEKLADAAMYAAKKLKEEKDPITKKLTSHYMQMRFENGTAKSAEIPPPPKQ